MGCAIDFKKNLLSFFLACVLLTHHARSTVAGRSLYIVHMDKSSMPKAFTTHDHWYSSTIRSLSKIRRTSSEGSQSFPQLVYSYDTVINGFSALLSQEELKSLKTSPGFVSAYIDREIKHRTTHTPQFLSLNPSSGIWPASKYGKDIIVGIIDTGVWPESRSFRDDGMSAIPSKWKGSCEEGEEFNASMCNLKLIGARYFNKGLISIQYPGFIPKMNSARDISGHGTHTASTAVGNYVDDVSYFGYAKGTASGIAPRARLAIYKIFWQEGSRSSDFLAGVDQALVDGVDVISLSLGYSFFDLPFYENIIAIASFSAMEKGIVISHSAGNAGPSFGSLYDSVPWTLTVGAGSVDRWFAGTLILGNGLTITGWSTFPAKALIENVTLVYSKMISSCNSTTALLQAPYGIIICEDIGDIRTQHYYVSSLSYYIVAAIYISNDTSYLLAKDTWPQVVISPIDAPAVIKYAQNNEPTASIRFQHTIVGAKPAPYVAWYSSRGPSRSYSGILKPDLIAPGSQVLAAWVPTLRAASIGSRLDFGSEYNILSGTSMACPHIAGVMALLKSAHPEWTPAMIRSAMMTTANPLDNAGNIIRDQGKDLSLASPLEMGSGHVDPNRALNPGLVYDATPEDYVNLLCYMNYTKYQLYTVTRSMSYDCSHPSPDLNYPSFIVLYSSTSSTKSVQTFKRILTSVGNGTTYHAKVIAPIGSNITITPKILVFNQIYQKKNFTMKIEYENNMNETVTYGSLVWVEDTSKLTVRSPIVISPDVKV